jgi:hypothetical protein
MSKIRDRVVEAMREEGKRWVFWTNLEAGRYEAWRWKDDLSEKTHIIDLGSDPGGVQAHKNYQDLVEGARAEAAIAAIRDPTAEMRWRGHDAIGNDLRFVSPQDIYQEMIDTALRDG